MDDLDRRFTSDEVSAIVRRALRQQVTSDQVSYADLVDIAQQSGISVSSLHQAIEEEDRLGALDRAKDNWLTRRKSRLLRHLRTYCIVNGFLFLINVATNPGGYLWVVWPLLGWGIGLAFHAAEVLFPKDEKVERGARRWLRREQRQRLRDGQDNRPPWHMR